MTAAEFRSKQEAADECDLRAADLFVAAGCSVITLLWVAFLLEVLA